uniref:F-box domain-containing protein n=2 Tax=Denticeps clupeoides TaxID=299321 RepID=A0AAY3ZV95_9TELE
MGTVKLRGSWDGGCSVAKRRRKVGALDKCRKLESHSPNPESRLAPLEDHLPQVEGEEGAKTVSVAEMVAYLEQIANCHQVNSKPFLLRTSSTATLSKSIVLQLPPADPGSVELPDPGQEEGESVRVLDMVAKLESECLKHQSSRESGELSRNNSLRRNVARVLLAGSEPYHVPARPEPPTVRQEERLEGPSVAGRHGRSDESRSSTLAEPHLPVERMEEGCMAEVECSAMEPGAEEEQQPGLAEEPLPGMLFFTAALPVVSEKHPATHTEVKVHPKMPLAGVPELTSNPWFSTQSEKELLHLASTLGLTERILQQAGGAEEEMVVEERKDCLLGRNLIPFPLRRQVSHEFLETRFKIQMLLEPQQYLAYLPHHIIVKIFSLLPTETLAALKCTCHYFKFIIENYGVRPADSRWVSDPRYRDDPCKQCKKRYGRGDVSLCRWHHKPYCQAMPYGPGYWMCCHGSQKDTPGCNVGLHDNRWVPAFHSISMPIYKNRDAEEAL